MEIDYYTYKTEEFKCNSCGWEGTGYELIYGAFNEDSFICDLDCPECGEHIGFWQSPVKNLKSPDAKKAK